MCQSNLNYSQRKDAATIKNMITKHLEGRLIFPIKTLTEHKANMFDIQAYLNTLCCRNIIGEWTIIPSVDLDKLTIRFQTTFLTSDEMVIYLR